MQKWCTENTPEKRKLSVDCSFLKTAYCQKKLPSALVHLLNFCSICLLQSFNSDITVLSDKGNSIGINQGYILIVKIWFCVVLRFNLRQSFSCFSFFALIPRTGLNLNNYYLISSFTLKDNISIAVTRFRIGMVFRKESLRAVRKESV